ncbi:hypothetical protein Hanom_Chr09g00854241 [Helianthus anomalus]
MRILDDQKVISIDISSCVIRYVDYESHKCVSGNSVHIPFDGHLCNVLFLASLDGMMLSNSNSPGFYSVDDDILGFCVDSAGDYNIVHIKCTRFRLSVNSYSFWEGSL